MAEHALRLLPGLFIVSLEERHERQRYRCLIIVEIEPQFMSQRSMRGQSVYPGILSRVAREFHCILYIREESGLKILKDAVTQKLQEWHE